MKFLTTAVLFDWDSGNNEKNWIKHKVKTEECEQTFFDDKNLVVKDIKHSGSEERFILLGMAKTGRKLHVTFTHRGEKIRVISARDQNKKERIAYENQNV